MRELMLLHAIRESSDRSQHELGGLTGLSSSMVNNYIKELKNKDRIYSSGKTNRSQTYHLTEKGKKRLISLMFSYSAEIVQMYSSVKLEIRKIMEVHYRRGVRKVVLFGAAETAEIVYTVLSGMAFNIIGVVDNNPEKQGKPFKEFTVYKPVVIRDIEPDAVVITSFGKQMEIHEDLREFSGAGFEVIGLTDTKDFELHGEQKC